MSIKVLDECVCVQRCSPDLPDIALRESSAVETQPTALVEEPKRFPGETADSISVVPRDTKVTSFSCLP